MNLHNVKSLTVYACVAVVAVAAALIFTSCVAFSAELYAASAPSVDNDKTTGRVYKLDLEDLTRIRVIETPRR